MDSREDCVICCHPISVFAYGQCEHPICFECSLKMRAYSRQFHCPVCRSELPKVLFTEVKEAPFSTASLKYFCELTDCGVLVSNQAVNRMVEHRMAFACRVCQPECVLNSMDQLRAHVKKVHRLVFCNICTAHLRLFPREFRLYDSTQIAQHQQKGDPDDRSHKGHPLCLFCKERYLDADSLFFHLRQKHWWCHLCESGEFLDYYPNYEELRIHFRSNHFLCETGRCATEELLSVFRTKMDLQMHTAAQHSNSMTKADARISRQLDIVPRQARGENGNQLGGILSSPVLEAPVQPPSLASHNDFPRLSSAEPSTSSRSVPSSASDTLDTEPKPSTSLWVGHNATSQSRNGRCSSEDFPSLPSDISGPAMNSSQSLNIRRPAKKQNRPARSHKDSANTAPTTVDFPSLGELPVSSAAPVGEWQTKPSSRPNSKIADVATSSSRFPCTESGFPNLIRVSSSGPSADVSSKMSHTAISKSAPFSKDDFPSLPLSASRKSEKVAPQSKSHAAVRSIGLVRPQQNHNSHPALATSDGLPVGKSLATSCPSRCPDSVSTESTALGEFSLQMDGSASTNHITKTTSPPSSNLSPKERNLKLVSSLQQLMCEESLLELKTASGQFRTGLMSAAVYYGNLLSLLGHEKLQLVIDDLIATLPEAHLQHALVEHVYNSARNGTAGPRYCLQATPASTSALEDDFPALSLHNSRGVGPRRRT